MQYSFIIPIYDDAQLMYAFCESFNSEFAKFLNIATIENDCELIFVNDGSPNVESNKIFTKTINHFPFAKGIVLSRNFGQHIALSAGYKEAKGNIVGMLNVDMQEPPSELIVLIKHMQATQADIVTGLVDKRKTSFINKITSNIFNRVLNKLTQNYIPLNVATIRIMNRNFTDAYNSLSEKSRYLPGLENWLGFTHEYTPVLHQPRTSGKSSYNFRKRLKMAVESIIGFSDYPLRLTASIGFLVAIIGFLMVLFLIISKLFYINYAAGYSSTIAIIIFIGGIQISVIGIAALYIGRILKEVQNRPLYIVKEKIKL